MDHVTKISTNHKIANRKEPVAVTSAIGQLRELDEASKGRGATQKGQKPGSTACDVANAFLKVQFYPRLLETECIQGCNNKKLERDYFKSLSIVSSKYNCSQLDHRRIPFPYNISESLAHLKKQLKNNLTDWKEIRLIQDGQETYFAREERFDTGFTLYYIPVFPLYSMLLSSSGKKVTNLLISVYAYLYQVLAIPYYRTDGCYLNSIYEMLENWIVEDDNDEDMLIEITDAYAIGDYMQELISDPKHVRAFRQRTKKFKPKTDFERKAHAIAEFFYSLSVDYPNVQIDRNFYPLRYREDILDRSIALDDYISFCASIEGCLFESLCQTVNDDLQEYGEIDEPVHFVPFGKKIQQNHFDFEVRVFEGLNNLIQLWQLELF